MKYALALALLLSGCTTINIKTADYCHTEDGTYLSSDPRCNKDLNPLRFENDQDSNSVRH